jgi:hypothetical protein
MGTKRFIRLTPKSGRAGAEGYAGPVNITLTTDPVA